MRRAVTALTCLGTGVLIAAALPPWGWWPLAFVGIACLDRIIADRPRGERFRRGMLVGLGLYFPSLAWMTDMTIPGYVIAVEAIFSLLAIRDNVAPPTINLDNPSVETAIDLAPHRAVKRDINIALSNSFGFGGTNASLVFRRVAS